MRTNTHNVTPGFKELVEVMTHAMARLNLDWLAEREESPPVDEHLCYCNSILVLHLILLTTTFI